MAIMSYEVVIDILFTLLGQLSPVEANWMWSVMFGSSQL